MICDIVRSYSNKTVRISWLLFNALSYFSCKL